MPSNSQTSGSSPTSIDPESSANSVKDISQILTITKVASLKNRYRHHLLKENGSRRSDLIEHLRPYFHEAHNDVRRILRRILKIDLDPLGSALKDDPFCAYPQCLSINTLKGCFGEVFAAWAIENVAALKKEGWRVPAFLFRWHISALQRLEEFRQTGKEAKDIPGRTGDDCLAFQIDEDWIVKNLKVTGCNASKSLASP